MDSDGNTNKWLDLSSNNKENRASKDWSELF